MNLWNEMDRGNLKEDEAFEEADKAIRESRARWRRRYMDSPRSLQRTQRNA